MPDYGISALLKGIREGSAARRLQPIEETAAEAMARQRAAVPQPVPLRAPEPIAPREVAPTIPDPAPPALPPALPPVEVPPPVSRQGEVDVPAEAARLQRLRLGDYDLGESWQPNYDMIHTADDVQAVIADAAERNRAQISASRRGVITHEELRRLAEDVGGETAAIEAVLRRETGGALPPPEVVLAARQFVNNSADRLLELSRKITAGQATDLDKIRFRRQVQLHDEFLQGFMGVRAEYGRGLNAFGIPLGVDKNPLMARRLIDLIGNTDGVSAEKIAADIAEKTSANAIAKAVRKWNHSRVGGVVRDLAYGGALSSPVTHEINIFGGALYAGMNIAETALAARVGRLLPGQLHARDGEATAMLFGLLSGTADAYRYAKRAFKEGAPISGIKTRRGEADFNRGITAKNLFREKGTSGIAGVDKAIDLIGAAIRFWPERVMVPADEFIKGVTRNMEAARLGYLAALDKASQGPMTADEFADAIRAYMDRPDVDALEDAAIRATYQQPLPQAIQRLATGIRSIPGGFLVAMFVKTPTNLFIEGLGKRSPLAVFNASVRRDIAAGGRARDLAVTRVALGSLTAALVASLAAGGNVTGAGPQNPAERDLWLASGRRPYSFRYYDPFSGRWKWQSYARAEPFAYVIGAVADAVEAAAAIGDITGDQADAPLRDASQQVNRVVSTVVAAVAQNTLNKTFMTGVSDFIEALSDPGRYMGGYITRLGNLLLPWSSFRAKLNQIEDPLIRQSWEELDVLKNKSGIPGLSKDAPPRRDPFGQIRKWERGEIAGVLSPFPASAAYEDETIEELLQVMRHTGRTPVTMPGKMIEGMAMTAHEYDEFVVRARAEPDASGLNFREALDELMASPTYQAATYDERLLLIKGTQERYDSRVRGNGLRNPGAMERENADFADRLAEFRIRKQEAMEGL